MKYIKNWNNYNKIHEAVVSSQDSLNLLNSIQKNPTLPLLIINTPKNNVAYVKLLQDTLKSQGYELEVNGIFDEKTKLAVMDYQSSNGLTKDGKVGRNTWKSILELNDINVEPKITNTTTTKPNTTTTKPNENNSTDFAFKNSKGVDSNFSDFKNSPNYTEVFKDKNKMSKLIENNKDNKQFILEFNKLYSQKYNKNLISYLTDTYSRSYLGGRSFEIGVKLFDILTNYIIDPISDAKIFNFCIKGLGTEDTLIELMFNKRAKMPETYKKEIISEYEKNYGTSFYEDMQDDGIDGSLIKKIDTKYFES